jgi:hypothetical protein
MPVPTPTIASVATARTPERWQLAAEKLVGDVRRLLDYHDALVSALGKSMGTIEAESRLRQLDRHVEALEIELWYAGVAPDKTTVGHITALLKKGLGKLVLGAIGATGGLVVNQAYEHLTAADAQAERVIQCVIEADDRIGDPSAGSMDMDLGTSVGTSARSDVIDGGDDATPPGDVIDGGDGATPPGDVTLQPAELKLGAVPVEPAPATSGGDPGRDVELQAVMDGGTTDASGDLTVTRGEGEATGTADDNDGPGPVRPEPIDAGAEVRQPQVGQVGTVVEHDMALPITPVRGASGSRIVSPPNSGRPASADVTGAVEATADDKVATAEGTHEDAGGPPSFTSGFDEPF